MASLFIANCLKQNQVVLYRPDLDSLPNTPAHRYGAQLRRSPTIPSGRQIILGGDMPIDQIDSIVKQLQNVGLRAEKEAGGLKESDGVVPYLFNVDQAVRASSIRSVVAHNSSVLVQQGRVRREQSAIGASQHVSSVTGVGPEYEVSVEQETISENDEVRIEEGFRVVRDRAQVPADKRSSGRQSRRGPSKAA